MREISAEKIDKNVFETIGKQWMLVGAEHEGKANAMTASWGGLGVMWNKNVAFVFIRPQRFTKKLIDKSEYLSLSFFDENYKSMLAYMGKASGANEDKIKNAGLTIVEDKAPVFEEASMTFVCKKLYNQYLDENSFLDKNLINQYYPANDFHEMYIVEIEKILIKD